MRLAEKVDAQRANRHRYGMVEPNNSAPAHNSVPIVFDRALLARRRAVADDFVSRTMLDSAQEQIQFIARTFDQALVISPIAPPQLARAQTHLSDLGRGSGAPCDLETPDLAPASFDLIVCIGGLNWLNDVPGALIQLRRALVPDGFFCAHFPGGDSLTELRSCLISAESEITGGAANRVNPMIDVRDAGALLHRAGFAMPVADVDRLTVRYANPMALLAELRSLGQAAAFADRAPALRRDVVAAFCSQYLERFSSPADGRISATLDLVSMSGWAPSADQPKPKPRGSAKVSLAQVLGTTSR